MKTIKTKRIELSHFIFNTWHFLMTFKTDFHSCTNMVQLGLIKLLESNIFRVFPEALSAHIQAVFPDETMSVRAGSAKNKHRYTILWIFYPSKFLSLKMRCTKHSNTNLNILSWYRKQGYHCIDIWFNSVRYTTKKQLTFGYAWKLIWILGVQRSITA